jgi:two-component system, sporulation sensor kinase E
MALRKPNVLVVDDKRANLIALEAVLGEAHNLVFAQSGEEAIATLQRRRDVDLILMDVQMPGLDGFETAQLIKRTDGCAEIPIIFVTAIFTEDPWIRRGYEVGGIDYFGKPFDPEILNARRSGIAPDRWRALWTAKARKASRSRCAASTAP